jgi:hypothetical protein
MWACLGVSPSAFLAWVAWIAAYSQLGEKAQLRFAWIGPLMLVSAIGFALLGLIAFQMDRSVKRVIVRDVEHVLEDMDHIYGPYQTNPE